MGTLEVLAKKGSLRQTRSSVRGGHQSNVEQITVNYAALTTFSTHTSTDCHGQPIMASAGTPS